MTGLLAVELFETPAGLLVNELAMRPHNCGHWTIEGARTSQFEQHLRAVLDLPLGSPALAAPATVWRTSSAATTTTIYDRYIHVMAADPPSRSTCTARRPPGPQDRPRHRPRRPGPP